MYRLDSTQPEAGRGDDERAVEEVVQVVEGRIAEKKTTRQAGQVKPDSHDDPNGII